MANLIQISFHYTPFVLQLTDTSVKEGVFSSTALLLAYFKPPGISSPTTGANCLGFAFITCKHSRTGLNTGRPHNTGFCNITDKTCVQCSILSSMRFRLSFFSALSCAVSSFYWLDIAAAAAILCAKTRVIRWHA